MSNRFFQGLLVAVPVSIIIWFLIILSFKAIYVKFVQIINALQTVTP